MNYDVRRKKIRRFRGFPPGRYLTRLANLYRDNRV